jgi:hypothetical protein
VVIVISFLLQIFYYQQQASSGLAHVVRVGSPLVLLIPSLSDAREQAVTESPRLGDPDYSTTRSASIEALSAPIDKISHAIVTAGAGALGM